MKQFQGWIAIDCKEESEQIHWRIAPRDYWEVNHAIPDEWLKMEVPGFCQESAHTFTCNEEFNEAQERMCLANLGFEVLDPLEWNLDFKKIAELLRDCHGSVDGKLALDAADAIELLLGKSKRNFDFAEKRGQAIDHFLDRTHHLASQVFRLNDRVAALKHENNKLRSNLYHREQGEC